MDFIEDLCKEKLRNTYSFFEELLVALEHLELSERGDGSRGGGVGGGGGGGDTGRDGRRTAERRLSGRVGELIAARVL